MADRIENLDSKRTFFIEAIRRKKYKDNIWGFSVFSVVENPKDYGSFYPYYNEENVLCFKDDDGNQIVFRDIKPDEPIIAWRDELIVNKGDLPNIFEDDIVTTYGRFFANAIVCEAFGSKIPFINKQFDAGDIEDIFKDKFADEPQFGEQYKDDEFYPSERMVFNAAVQHTARYNAIFVPSFTEKCVLPPPGIQEFRQQLMVKYKDRLDDPVAIAQLEKELIEYDTKYLKGDRGADGFLIGGKDRKIVRKRLFLSFGGLAGFREDGKVDYIPQALDEGIQLDHMPEYNNDTRQGSYGRGVGTQIGGADVKRTLRATNNLEITIDDCGVTYGIKYLVTKKDQRRYEKLYYIVKGSPVLFKDGDAEKYDGQYLEFRSPAYCKSDTTTFCKVCCGEQMSVHEHGLAEVASQTSNVIMGLSMAAMHGKESKTAEYDIMSLIN